MSHEDSWACEHLDEHEPGCPVSVLRAQGKARGMHSAGSAREHKTRSQPNLYGAGISKRIDNGGRFGDGDQADRFFFSARASTRERNAGLSDFYWKREPEHPDGWRRIKGPDLDKTETLAVELSPWGNGVLKVALLAVLAGSRARVTSCDGTQGISARSWSTILFGSDTTAPSLMESASTIGTRSRPTTGSRILRWLITLPTSASIRAASCETGPGGSPVGTAESSSQSIASITISTPGGIRCPGASDAISGELSRIRSVAVGAEPLMRGNVGPCVKPLEVNQWLARLILPPTIPGADPPRILIPFAGTGSEALGAALGGWKDIVSIEHSEQMVEVSEARLAWWLPLIEAGGVDVRAMLGEGDELNARMNGRAPVATGETLPLFAV